MIYPFIINGLPTRMGSWITRVSFSLFIPQEVISTVARIRVTIKIGDFITSLLKFKNEYWYPAGKLNTDE